VAKADEGRRGTLFRRKQRDGRDDTVCGEVEAPIALVVRGVANGSAQGRMWCELVRSDGGEIGVAGAPKSPEVMVGREGAIESE
jgi:hypothetical protein